MLDKRNNWIDVPEVDDAFVVNIGDLMAVWTNDAWVSTNHRVMPPTGSKRQIERVSIPFFHQPNWSAVIECLPSCQDSQHPPRHAPVTSGDYLLGKIQAAFGG